MSGRQRYFSRAQVVRLLEVEEELLLELEHEAVVRPDAEGRYPRAALERVRVCHTLRCELGVNMAGVEVALNLLDTMARERRQFSDALSWIRRRLGDQGGGQSDDG